jgi:hypothetical protein
MRWVVVLMCPLVFGCAGVRAAAPSPVAAAALVTVPALDANAPDLRRAKYEPELYTHESIDNGVDTSGGIIRVRAPIDIAEQAMLDFRDMMQLTSDANVNVLVVGQNGNTRDVYVHVNTIIPDYYIWTVIRFEPHDEGVNGRVYSGHQIDGNLDELRIFWRLIPDGQETLARFELLAVPTMPLPKKWIYRDTRKGVLKVIETFKSAVETRAHPPEPRHYEENGDFDEDPVE